MKAPEKVSIIVPVYNVAEYLSASITSCIRQTLMDIEIICVNDGSTDNSLEILKEFQRIDSRIQIVDQPNRGVSTARNAGMEKANGEWILFLDADDRLAPEACERIWAEGKQGPTDVIVCGAEVFPEYPEPESWLIYNLWARTHREEKFSARTLFCENSVIPFVWRKAFRRELLEKNSLRFDENLDLGEDTLFLLETFPNAEHISFIEDKLFLYRWYRPGSAMENYGRDLDIKIEKHLLILERACEFWQGKGWLSLYGSEFVGWMLRFIVPDIQRPEVHQKEEHKAHLLKILQEYQLMGALDHLHGEEKALKKKLRI